MNKEKIGLAILTYNRPEYFEQCFESIPRDRVDEFIVIKDGGDKYPNQDKYAKDCAFIDFFENGYNCRAKNTAWGYMRAKGCKHLFIIEDDAIITDPNIFDAYIDCAYKTGIWHLMYLKVADNKHMVRLKTDDLELHRNCQGTFMFTIDKVVEHVGEWDIGFKNAFTHVDWTYRVVRAGLMPPFWWFPDVRDSQKLMTTIPGSDENSSITNKELYQKNYRASAEHFVQKYGHFTNQIKDSTEAEVRQQLEYLKSAYSRSRP